MNPNFLDLFAGGGGLSEGFIQAGFLPIAHVEMDRAASYTLKTRMAYHWLIKNDQLEKYIDYLYKRIDRTQLYSCVPEKIIDSVINETISSVSIDYIFSKVDYLLGEKKLDLLIGGPPCQAYSLVGRARDIKGMLGDKRNYLYRYYALFLKRYRPAYFIFENVVGLLSAKDGNGKLYFDNMINLFYDMGYQTEFMILDAKNYGVPQNRRRVIIVGKKAKGNGFFPEPDKVTLPGLVNELLNSLPSLKAGEGSISPVNVVKKQNDYLLKSGIASANMPITFHSARDHSNTDLEIYKIAINKWNRKKERLNYNDLPDRLKTHNNRESFLDRFKVVAGEKHYSHTVVAHIAKDGHYYIHPDIKQNRSLTPREAARLQTFPDNYFFESASEKTGRTAAYHQIGNAVPVLLARKIAEKLREEF